MTLEEILYNLEPKVSIHEIITTSHILLHHAEFIEITIKDRLFMNYKPQIIKRFLHTFEKF